MTGLPPDPLPAEAIRILQNKKCLRFAPAPNLHDVDIEFYSEKELSHPEYMKSVRCLKDTVNTLKYLGEIEPDGSENPIPYGTPYNVAKRCVEQESTHHKPQQMGHVKHLGSDAQSARDLEMEFGMTLCCLEHEKRSGNDTHDARLNDTVQSPNKLLLRKKGFPTNTLSGKEQAVANSQIPVFMNGNVYQSQQPGEKISLKGNRGRMKWSGREGARNRVKICYVTNDVEGVPEVNADLERWLK
ncbi:hypothetical protein B0H19DRAFT_1085367 [Mycena capillaripes]|nr:hypothetical protein B0H19DRAFT_1085367 [Mycena capillaripes]